MQVKKFEAPTIQEALDTIKRELGPEAIILQTRKNNRGFGLMSKGSVEVTAAISQRSFGKKRYLDDRIPEDSKKALESMPADRQASFYDRYMGKYIDNQARSTGEKVQIRRTQKYADMGQPAQPPQPQAQAPVQPRQLPRQLPNQVPPPVQQRMPQPQVQPQAASPPINSGHQAQALQEEMNRLKAMMADLKKTPQRRESFETRATQEVFEKLTLSGVHRNHAYDLIKQNVSELESSLERVIDQTAMGLMESIEISDLFSDYQQNDGPLVVALVGPTGVGKTTTLAKIASQAKLQKGLKVGLINVDTYKLAATDQLNEYGKILNMPVRTVATEKDLDGAIADYKNLDVILVDTTGRSHKDTEALNRMKSVLGGRARTQLVLSASTRDSDMDFIGDRFSIFKPDGVIFSKLDETASFGSIYSFCQKHKLPLSYFATGQRVPEDFEAASKERLTALILGL